MDATACYDTGMKTLRQHRLDRVLTIRELAALAGVSPQTIVGMERGRDARFSSMRRVAEALGVPVREVAEFSGTLAKVERGHDAQQEQ